MPIMYHFYLHCTYLGKLVHFTEVRNEGRAVNVPRNFTAVQFFQIKIASLDTLLISVDVEFFAHPYDKMDV